MLGVHAKYLHALLISSTNADGDFVRFAMFAGCVWVEHMKHRQLKDMHNA